jgi:mRNA-degrading endonuclease toxin of MazEF toxin-antitoxin module
MPSACCLTLDNVTVIRASLCVERITRLSPARMSEVCAALALATACGDHEPRSAPRRA